MFKSKKRRRFFMHLIAQHILISQHNSAVLQPSGGELAKLNKTGQLNEYSAFGVMGRYFQHSCAPNVIKTFDDAANVAYFLVRPVKQGEEVLISYLPFDFNCKKRDRQVMLRMQKGFMCDCLRCIGVEACAAVRNRISADADYHSILSMDQKNPCDKVKILPQLIEKCVAFLQKYGKNDWCHELGRIIRAFEHAFRMQFKQLAVF